MKRHLLLSLVLILVTPSAFAWGEKGHLLTNQAAAYGLPAEMPHFVHRAYSQLIYLGPEPDRWKGGGESLEGVNPPDHFLDYEYVSHLELPRQRYAYLALLEQSGTLRELGIANATAGFLPWKIAEVTEALEVQWRLWRDAEDGSIEKGQIEQNIIQLAGVLGHYVADSANPHHATVNYNGWVEENPHGFATDCETHSRFESTFVSRAITFSDVYPRIAAPQLRKDYFASALESVRASNALVETLYVLDRDGAFSGAQTDKGVEFATARLAAAASLLRDLWWSTFVNSAEAPTKRR
ncbi:MAG: phospholipase C/P1 nuclease family protein [Thermoanaerobaculia bacterium]